jgi:hypothetical protein
VFPIRTAVLLGAAFLTLADDPKPRKPRPFLGSLQVPPDRRDEVLGVLKAKGFPGVYVPDGAAPETILYRGPKAEYEAALDAFNRHLHPDWYGPPKTR